MIKVAHVVSSLNIGGAERFVIDLCDVQKGLNINPTVISLGTPKELLVGECKKKNIAVVSYNHHPIFKLIRLFIALLKFDVIHIHSQHALKFLSYTFPLLHKKIIYTRHGAAPLSSPEWVSLHLKVKPFVNIATFVSQEGLDIFQQNHGWESIPNYVIDNGVLISPLMKNADTNISKLRIGSVGRMIPLKNQLGLLKAINTLAEVTQTQIEVNFFGDGECSQSLTAYKKEHLAKVDVIFHGMVNDREKIYSSFDVLVVTSETEGLSMVIIEAMANKLPVIATNVGGNPKLVINGQTGWLFEYNDDEKLAEIIQNVINNKALISAIGDNAFSYISENFSIDTSAKKYAELYEN
ncbi:MAG: glycosyltransferase family 4 protein [Colwellia sp.]|nr:glycosyltransferase family 4 protein [Colwellia sp.]